MNGRRICVVTGSRAEYGLLRWVMRGVAEAPDMDLQVIATGMHLSPEFGHTYREIEGDGFAIDRRVEMLLSSDSPVGVGKSVGLGVVGFADALHDLAPDCMLVLGDRFEILAAVTAALMARIPVAHIHGGEVTEGAIDDSIRHAVTKMSHLHFVAADEYGRRVVQLGESPDRVHVVGSLGVESAKRLPVLEKDALARELDVAFDRPLLVVTFHPVTVDENGGIAQMSELLAALGELDHMRFVFTMPNADTGGRAIRQLVEAFVASNAHAHAFTSLGQLRYLSCVRHADAVVGNSSSGIIEAPAFGVGTVNIGDRQAGRLRANSVVDCPPERAAIRKAIERVTSSDFRKVLDNIENPYGEGNASERIIEALGRHDFAALVRKSFHDLPGR